MYGTTINWQMTICKETIQEAKTTIDKIKPLLEDRRYYYIDSYGECQILM